MRDPKRIHKIVETLETIWQVNPDWRLGQLLVNATGITGDMFFIEDKDMLDALERAKKDYT